LVWLGSVYLPMSTSRRSSSVFKSASWITRHISTLFPIFSMRRDARHQFSRIVSHGVSMILLALFIFHVGVSTYGVGFPTPCPVSSRDPPTLNIPPSGGVKTPDFGFQASFAVEPRKSPELNEACFGGVAMIIVTMFGFGSPSCPMPSRG
jgi:hypothetical protein